MKSRIRITTAAALALFAATALPSHAPAQSGVRQYSRQTSIGGRLPVSVILVGYTKDASDIEKLFDIVLARANGIYAKLDGSNPSSETARIAAGGEVATSPEVTAAFDAIRKVCEWTKGAFDVVSEGSGSCRDIRVGKSSVTFKGSGARFDLSPIMNGFMAEMISKLIYTAGMKHVIVKVGYVFRGYGQGMGVPWKVQIQDDAGTFARHALNLTVINTGIATVSASQYRGTASGCRGVVAVMNDAALAEGVAYAAFRLGPGDGFKLLSKVAKGLVVDGNGKFMRTPGF
ncbi:MAG TPA: FAD:protein FMN transferase [bacterium]|nr:FAD:protein FMN transferase [bacterium]